MPVSLRFSPKAPGKLRGQGSGAGLGPCPPTGAPGGSLPTPSASHPGRKLPLEPQTVCNNGHRSATERSPFASQQGEGQPAGGPVISSPLRNAWASHSSVLVTSPAGQSAPATATWEHRSRTPGPPGPAVGGAGGAGGADQETGRGQLQGIWGPRGFGWRQAHVLHWALGRGRGRGREEGLTPRSGGCWVPRWGRAGAQAIPFPGGWAMHPSHRGPLGGSLWKSNIPTHGSQRSWELGIPSACWPGQRQVWP